MGTKNEFRTSSTVKVGNKNTGYSEHTVEERFRDVEHFGKLQGPPMTKCLTHNNSGSDSYSFVDTSCSDYGYGYRCANNDYDDYY